MFQQPSPMSTQAHFSQVPRSETPRSKFDRSCSHKTTFDGGKLIPIFADEVLPGDTMNMNATGMIRFATPLKPIMDNIHVDVHWFFVPNRLAWTNWPKFMGERTNPSDNPDDIEHPYVSYILSAGDGDGMHNYLGVPYRPDEGTTAVTINSLPLRAIQLIWNEWFRDQNLQDSEDAFDYSNDGGDGLLSSAPFNGFTPYPRGKRHDYFTSCLPFPQKGEAVLLPFPELTVAPEGNSITPTFRTVGDGTPQGEMLRTLLRSGESDIYDVVVDGDTAGNLTWNTPGLEIQQDTDFTINDLRLAFQIQKLLERDARGGTRYIELILNHFGVSSSDARLQRPELLGSSTDIMNINPVAATVAQESAPQGNLAAFAVSLSKSRFKKSFEEHGWIIGFCSVRADLTYQQGLERQWSRRTRYDYYWPSLAHIGEQAVLNQEIYLQEGNVDANEEVFGYQERWAEYRYKPSRITGKFISEDPESLDVWHCAQEFASLPALNSDFIEEDPPFDRVIAVPSEPQFLADFYFNYHSQRPMPTWSVPGLIDHF